MRRLILSLAFASLTAACGGNLPPIVIPTPPPCPQPTPCPPPNVCPECPACPVCPACPATCEGVTCPEGKVCKVVAGEPECVDVVPIPPPTCDGFSCPAGQHCELKDSAPACVPNKPPPPADCSKFRATTTGWGLLTCTLNNKLYCGHNSGKKCGCDGPGCSFNIPLNAACSADSTPRYFGSLPNWKTCDCADPDDPIPCEEWPTCTGGEIGISEYPPPKYYGWDCAKPTAWSVPKGVEWRPDPPPGFGGAMKFKTRGKFQICAARDGAPALSTCKNATVQ